MRKCIVVSDSFKGTLSSLQICSICGEHIREVFPDCEVITLPVADGGEGTVDCFVSALGAVPVHAEVTGALGEKTDAVYAVLDGTAFIEMSSAAGLPSVGDRKDPGITTTYGVGELIRDAVDRGCGKILLGLGGSATNDAGCGCAAALGTVFRDADDLVLHHMHCNLLPVLLIQFLVRDHRQKRVRVHKVIVQHFPDFLVGAVSDISVLPEGVLDL